MLSIRELFRSGARSFGDGDHKLFKFLWQGNSEGTNGIAIAINGQLTEIVLEVSRVHERVMCLKLVLGHTLCNVVSA